MAEYTVIDVEQSVGGVVSVMTNTGETKEDLNLPTLNEGAEHDPIAQSIIDKFEEEGEAKISVLTIMGEEIIDRLVE